MEPALHKDWTCHTFYISAENFNAWVKFWSRDFFSELAASRKSSNSELGTPVLLN